MPGYRRIVIGIVTAGVLAVSAGHADDSITTPLGKVYVLAVGVEQYAHTENFNDLNYAVEDATGLATLFNERFGYETTVLTDTEATKDRIYAELDRLRGIVGRDDAVIFFFAGHGSTHKQITSEGQYKGFMIPYIDPAVVEDLVDQSEDAGGQGGVSEGGSQSATGASPGAHDGQPSEHADAVDGGNAGDAPSSGAEESDEGDIESEDVAATDETPETKTEAGAVAADSPLSAAAQVAMAKEKAVAAQAAMLEASLPMVGVRDRLTSMRCRHVVMILDACFSGLANTRSGGLPGSETTEEADAILSRYFDALDPSRIVFTAGTGGQESLEHTGQARSYSELASNAPPREGGITHGVFTYEVLEVLRAVDETGLSIHELHTLVKPRVRRVAVEYRGVGATGKDRSKLMTPQLREFSESEETTGGFVFVPKPEENWLERVRQSVLSAAAARQADAAGTRGESTEELLSIFRADAQQTAQEKASRAKLESKAMVALAFRASQNRSIGDDEFARDVIWENRFEETLAKASTGDPDAMAAMYYMHAYGLGTTPDEQEASRWASEAAASDSADAQRAYMSALENRLDVDEASKESAADAIKSLESDTEAKARLATVGTVIAVTQMSNNSGAQKAGLAVSGAILAAELFARLENAPKESIQSQVVRMNEEIERLAAEMRVWKDGGRVDKRVFDEVYASLPPVVKNIQTKARHDQAQSYDKTVLNYTDAAARRTRAALKNLRGPWGRSSPKARAEGMEHFDELERAFGELIALLPYIEYSANWNDG